MTLDLRQLNAFLAIVATGSLGRAAETLHITQPALSRTVRRLEEHVGAPLFERHSKGMQLTAIGATLLPRATLLQSEAEQALEEINAMRGLSKGMIRVGAGGSIASYVLPLAIGAVLRKRPNLAVFAVEGVWHRLSEALVKREIDLALAVSGVATHDDIEEIADFRWTDTTYVVAATSHPLQKKRKLVLADTLQEQWAIPPKGTSPYEQMRRVFREQGLGMPNVVVETTSVTVLKSLVAHSGFLSWMVDSIYEAERRAKMVATLKIPGMSTERTLTAFKRRQGILPGPASKLLEELRLLMVR